MQTNINAITLYHGTTKKFNAFDMKYIGSSTESAWAHLGFFFTPDPVLAGKFAKGKNWTKNRARFKLGANVIPVFLTIKNPLYIPVHKLLSLSNSHNKIKEIRRNAERDGYDGIIIGSYADSFNATDPTGELGHPQYIAFFEHQISSAIKQGYKKPQI